METEKQKRVRIIKEGIRARINENCRCPYYGKNVFDSPFDTPESDLWEKGWNETHKLICSVCNEV